MRVAERVAFGACAVAVAGLAALALPAFAAIGDTARDFAKASASLLRAGAAGAGTERASADGSDNPYDVNAPSRWAGDCTQNSAIYIGAANGAHGAASAELRGPDLIDMGPSPHASGTVTVDGRGRLATYTVAEGDAPAAIGERFCVDYVTVLSFNNTFPTIHPGDVLSLLPQRYANFFPGH